MSFENTFFVCEITTFVTIVTLLQENISSSIKLAYLTIPAGSFHRYYKCLNSGISCAFNLLHVLAGKSSILAYAMPLYPLKENAFCFFKIEQLRKEILGDKFMSCFFLLPNILWACTCVPVGWRHLVTGTLDNCREMCDDLRSHHTYLD